VTALASYFTEAELQPIEQGIRTFIRLMGLIADETQYKWFADEHDAVSALKSIVERFQLTERVIGKPKYQGHAAFDPTRQVRDDIEGSLLTGHTDMITFASRKRNSPLFYLIIEPVIQLFAKFDHASILHIVKDCIDEIIEMFNGCDAYGTYDDALVAQFQTRAIIHEREEATKLIKTGRRKNRKKDVALETVIDQLQDAEDMEISEEVTEVE
jgi:hypothetical protein